MLHDEIDELRKSCKLIESDAQKVQIDIIRDASTKVLQTSMECDPLPPLPKYTLPFPQLFPTFTQKT